MKRILYSMLAFALATITLTGCEDVPAPYDDPNNNGITNETEAPKGDGTLENPFNAMAANAYTEALAADQESDKDIYMKGVVVEVKTNFDNDFGNAEFYIADSPTSTNRFYVYRALYLGNKKYTSGDLLQEGDTVVVCGKVVNYKGNTPETATGKAYVYSINGKTDNNGGGNTEGEATGDGTLENPFNSVAANKYASSLGADKESDNDVYIKGKIVSIKEQFSAQSQYGNATFYISDDGTAKDQFYVFRTLYLGNKKYTEGTLPQVGNEVIICGKVVNYYGNTPETAANKSYIYKLTSNGGGDNPGEDTGDGFTVDVNSFGLENASALTTLVLGNGTTLTFSDGGGNNGPKYYTTGGGTFRIYPGNTMTVKSSKTVESITIECDEYNGTLYNASGNISSTAGNVEAKGTPVTISGISGKEFTIKNTNTGTGGATQLRIKKMIIKYAK